MKLNIAWGILAKGIPITTYEYGRTFDETAYKSIKSNIIDILVPYTTMDSLQKAHRIEELIKLILRSSLKERFETFDSFNTYSKATLQYPAPGLYTSSPTPLNIKVKGKSPIGRLRIFGQVTGSNTLTYDEGSDNILLGLTNNVHVYAFTDGQSGDIPVIDDILFIRLRSDAPANFSLGLEYIEKLYVDWEGLLQRLQNTKYTFKSAELKDIWQNEFSWVEKIAAFTMDVLETYGG